MSQYNPLPRSFYLPSAAFVAPRLLGHWLLRNTPSGLSGGLIVETEAYLSDDPACHAAPGLTSRNRVMFGPPGHAYVYLIYGYHYCVNAVCRPKGTGEAVLIRALQPLVGMDAMRRSRPVRREQQLTSGPAKLCQALGIAKALDGADLCDCASAVWVARNERAEQFAQAQGPVVTTKRVGITRAAELPLRFYLARNPFVSAPRVNYRLGASSA